MNVKRFYIITGITVGVLAILALLMLSLNYRVDFVRQTLQKQYHDLVDHNEQLTIELSMSSDLNEVYTMATEQLDMVFPDRIVYVNAKH